MSYLGFTSNDSDSTFSANTNTNSDGSVNRIFGLRDASNFIEEKGIRSKYLDKLVETTATINQKLELAGSKLIDHQANLNGIEQGFMIGGDGDTGEISKDGINWLNLPDGTDRFYSATQSNNDTMDFMEDWSKAKYGRQYNSAKQYFGPNPTSEQVRQLEQWQSIEMYKLLKDPDNYSIEPFDPSANYDKTKYTVVDGYNPDGTPNFKEIDTTKEALPVFYRRLGTGNYGRNLTEVFVKTKNGLLNVTEAMANNPYMNTAYNPFEARDTEYNRTKAISRDFTPRERQDAKILDDESFSMMYRNAVGGFNSFYNLWKSNRDGISPEAKRHYRRLAEQELQDAAHNIPQRVRDKFNESAAVAAPDFDNMWKSFDKGDYTEAATQFLSGMWKMKGDWEILVSDSAPQTLSSMIPGAIASAGIGAALATAPVSLPAIAVGALAFTGGAIVNTLIGSYMQLQDEQRDFEKNNGGKSPTEEQLSDMYWHDFIAYAPESVIEQMLTKVGGGTKQLSAAALKAFTKAVRKGAANAATQAAAGTTVASASSMTKSTIKALGHTGAGLALSSFGEAPEEFYQQLTQNYNSRNREMFPDSISQADYFRELVLNGGDPNLRQELAQAAAGGMVAGAAMGGAAVVAGTGSNIKSITKASKLYDIYSKLADTQNQSSSLTPEEQQTIDNINMSIADATYKTDDDLATIQSKALVWRDSLGSLNTVSNKDVKNSIFDKAFAFLTAVNNSVTLTKEEKKDIYDTMYASYKAKAQQSITNKAGMADSSIEAKENTDTDTDNAKITENVPGYTQDEINYLKEVLEWSDDQIESMIIQGFDSFQKLVDFDIIPDPGDNLNRSNTVEDTSANPESETGVESDIVTDINPDTNPNSETNIEEKEEENIEESDQDEKVTVAKEALRFFVEDALSSLERIFYKKHLGGVTVENNPKFEERVEALRKASESWSLDETTVNQIVDDFVNKVKLQDDLLAAELAHYKSMEDVDVNDLVNQIKEEIGLKTSEYLSLINDPTADSKERYKAFNYIQGMPITMINKLNAYYELLSDLASNSSNYLSHAKKSYLTHNSTDTKMHKRETMDIHAVDIRSRNGNNAVVNTIKQIIKDAKQLNEIARRTINPTTNKPLATAEEYETRKADIAALESSINSVLTDLITKRNTSYSKQATAYLQNKSSEDATSKEESTTVEENDFKTFVRDLKRLASLVSNSDIRNNLVTIENNRKDNTTIQLLATRLTKTVEKYGIPVIVDAINNDSTLTKEEKESLTTDALDNISNNVIMNASATLRSAVSRLLTGKHRVTLEKRINRIKNNAESVVEKVRNSLTDKRSPKVTIALVEDYFEEAKQEMLFINNIVRALNASFNTSGVDSKLAESIKKPIADLVKSLKTLKHARELLVKANPNAVETAQNSEINSSPIESNEHDHSCTEGSNEVLPTDKGRADSNKSLPSNIRIREASKNRASIIEHFQTIFANSSKDIFEKLGEMTSLFSKEILGVKTNKLHNLWAANFNPHNLEELNTWHKNLINNFNQMFSNEYTYKDIEELVNNVINNEAFTLLFNINKNDNGTYSVTINEEYAPLIGAAIFEFFSTDQYLSLFNPDPDAKKTVLASFGISDFGPDMSAESYADLADTRGIPRDVVQNVLGKLIADHLGITVNNNKGTTQFFDQLVSGLGLIAVDFVLNYSLPCINSSSISADNSILIESEITIDGIGDYNTKEPISVVRLNPEFREATSTIRYTKTSAFSRQMQVLKSHDSYTVYDTETARLVGDESIVNFTNQTPIQISATTYTKNANGKFEPSSSRTWYIELDSEHEIVSEFDGQVNPMVEDYRKNASKAVNKKQAITEFIQFVLSTDSVLVGHNIRAFDSAMIAKEAREAGVEESLILKFENKKQLDTLELSKEARSGADNHRQKTIAQELGFNFDNQAAHNAVTDVKADQAILEAFIELEETGEAFTVEGDIAEAIRTKAVAKASTYSRLRNTWQYIKRNGKVSDTEYGFFTEDNVHKDKDGNLHNPESHVRNVHRLLRYTDEQQAILDELFKEKFTISNEAFLNILTSLDDDFDDKSKATYEALKTAMGYIDEDSDEYRRATKELRESIRGVNTSISQELNGLIKVAKAVKEGRNIYFNRYFGRNGRVYIDGVEINPQNFKRIQRFVIHSTKEESSYSTNEKDLLKNKGFIFAVKQTFDALKKSDKEVMPLIKGLLSLNDEQLNDCFNRAITGSLDSMFKGSSINSLLGKRNSLKVENRGQLISFIAFLQARNANKANTTFTAYLPVEIDASSSGIAIKYLQFMPPSILESMGAALGFVSDTLAKAGLPKTAHGVKALKNKFKGNPIISDVYSASVEDFLNVLTEGTSKITANGISEFVRTYIDSTASSSRTKNLIEDLVTNKDTAPKETLEKLITSLLSAYGITAGKSKIETANSLRNLFKNPIMTYTYSAGLETITKKLSKQLWKEMSVEFCKYMASSDKENLYKKASDTTKAKIDFMQTFAEIYFTDSVSMYKALRSNTSGNINVFDSEATSSVRQTFVSLVNIGMTGKMYELMSKTYKDIDIYNDFMGVASGYAFREFENAYKDLVKDLSNTYGGKIPIKVLLKALTTEEFKAKFPTIAPIVANQVSTLFFAKKGAICDYRKDYNGKIVRTIFRDKSGTTRVATAHHETINWLTPGQAGKVIDIHNIDSFQEQFAQNMFPSKLGIFDAFVSDANSMSEVSKRYNMSMWFLNMTYSIPEAYLKMFDDAVKAAYERDKVAKRHTDSFDFWCTTTNVIDSYGNTFKNGKTIKAYRNDLIEAMKDLEERKKAFYGTFNSKGKFVRGSLSRIQNMDGLENSAFTVEDFEKTITGIKSLEGIKEFFDRNINPNRKTRIVKDSSIELADPSFDRYSKASKKDSTEQVVLTGEATIADRKNIMQQLFEREKNLVDKEYLDEMYALFDICDSDALSEVSVTRVNDGLFNNGSYYPIEHSIQLISHNKAYDKKVRSAEYNRYRYTYQSTFETFIHEHVHALTSFALRNGPHTLYTKADFIWNQTKNYLQSKYKGEGWKAFLPSDFDNLTDSQKAMWVATAKEKYGYCFELGIRADNTETDLTRRLLEFFAHAVSDINFRKVLKESIYTPNSSNNMSVHKRIITVLKNIFNVVFRGKSLTEALGSSHDLINGARPIISSHNLYRDVTSLVISMSKINAKNRNKLSLADPVNSLNIIIDALTSPLKIGNKVIKNGILGIANLDPNYVNEHIGDKNFLLAFRKGQRLKALWSWSKGGFAMFYSNQARAAVIEALQVRSKLAQEGFWLSWLRDITKPDEQTQLLHEYNNLRALLEENAKAQEAIVYQTIHRAFGRDLASSEEAALYDVVLKGDLQCLTSRFSIDEIKHLLTDKHALDTAIKEAKQRWVSVVDKKTVSNIQAQSFGLSYMMQTGKAGLGQLYNASDIVESVKGAKNSDTAQLIDEYVTLLYLNNMSEVAKLTLNNMENHGLNEYINLHKKYVNDSKTTVDSHIIKGYTHALYDGGADVLIAGTDPDTRASLEKRGYTLLDEASVNGKFRKAKLGVYKAPYPIDNTISNSTIAMNGVNNTIMNFSEESYVEAFENKVNATTDFKAVMSSISSDRAKAIANFGKLSEKEIIDNAGDFMMFHNRNLYTVDSVNYVINEDIAINVMGKNVNGTRVLANMYGASLRKTASSIHNQAVIKFLEDDFRYNAKPLAEINGIETYRVGSKVDKDGNVIYNRSNNIRYVELTNQKMIGAHVNPNYDKHVAEMWDKLPIYIRDYCKTHKVYIRADWTLDLFGVQNTSLAEWNVLKNWNSTYVGKMNVGLATRKIIVMLEQLLRLMTHVVKNDIIFRMPRVLIMNVLSNIALSTLTFSNPIKVLHYQLRTFKDLNLYVADKNEYDLLTFKYVQTKGALTRKELQRKLELENKIKHNRLYPLIEAGLFGNISKDIENNNKSDSAWLQNSIKNLVSKDTRNSLDNVYTRGAVRTAKELQLSQGTFMFETMYRLTQYSDFVARGAEFFILTEGTKIIDKNNNEIIKYNRMGQETEEYIKYKEELIRDLSYKFVNYELPVSSKEHYLNSIGFLLFTKFRKRIQWVLREGIIEHPLTAILLFAAGMYFDFSATPIHDVWPYTSMLRSFHSPFDNFCIAITPGISHMFL